MIRQEVERVEVEVLGLHLRALGDLPAHRDEHVGDLLGDDADRVAGADRLTLRRQRHVDGLGDEHGGVALGEQHGAAIVECRGDPGTGDVHALARVGLLLTREGCRVRGGRGRSATCHPCARPWPSPGASRSAAEANAFSALSAAAVSASSVSALASTALPSSPVEAAPSFWPRPVPLLTFCSVNTHDETETARRQILCDPIFAVSAVGSPAILDPRARVQADRTPPSPG